MPDSGGLDICFGSIIPTHRHIAAGTCWVLQLVGLLLIPKAGFGKKCLFLGCTVWLMES